MASTEIKFEVTTLNALALRINQIAKEHGFWDEERNMGEMLMLAVSELAEALEEHRSGKPNVYYVHTEDCAQGQEESRERCNCIPKPEGLAVEIADCIIRCMDTMYSLDVDIDAIVREKMRYNYNRPRKHGRAY
jgi:NTP pyrophosphatase (non-canonical NTP hydrolase)